MKVSATAASRLTPPGPDSFGSRLRSAAVAARVGLWLGVCFGLAMATGLISHYAQQPSQPVPFPTHPAWGYRVTQWLHVASGTAAIPLLLVKLWVVFPRLLERPPRTLRRLALTVLERGSIAILVASAITQLTTGLLNVSQWYAWGFSFRRTHYALAFVTIGALLIHIAVKLPVIRDVLGIDIDATMHDRPSARHHGALSRRGLLRLSWIAAGTAVLTSTVGTMPGLSRLSVLAPRSRAEGIPINRTAADAQVTTTATSPDYRCEVTYADQRLVLTRDDLLGFTQHTHTLPIACVEGWSVAGRWTGPRLRDVLAATGAPPGRDVRVSSLQQHGGSRVTILPADFVDDERTLLALALDGEPLSLDHGYPARLIAPNRPGALQTKWVARIEVLG